MTYVYDVLLNFNKEYFDFYDWSSKDDVKYFRKIPVIVIESSDINNLINKEIQVPEDFLNLIKNKYELYEGINEQGKYLVLFTDLKKVIGICFNDNGNNVKISSLTLEEEDSIIEMCYFDNKLEFEYQILKIKYVNKFLTRKEIKKKKDLIQEFNYCFNKNNNNKLLFYYYEYFNKQIENPKEAYDLLIESLNDYNEKHNKLFELLSLSYEKK